MSNGKDTTMVHEVGPKRNARDDGMNRHNPYYRPKRTEGTAGTNINGTNTGETPSPPRPPPSSPPSVGIQDHGKRAVGAHRYKELAAPSYRNNPYSRVGRTNKVAAGTKATLTLLPGSDISNFPPTSISLQGPGYKDGSTVHDTGMDWYEESDSEPEPTHRAGPTRSSRRTKLARRGPIARHGRKVATTSDEESQHHQGTIGSACHHTDIGCDMGMDWADDSDNEPANHKTGPTRTGRRHLVPTPPSYSDGANQSNGEQNGREALDEVSGSAGRRRRYAGCVVLDVAATAFSTIWWDRNQKIG